MPSVWIRTRVTKDGSKRYLVEWRVGGRETKNRHGGSYRKERLAALRAGWIENELAAGRIPDLALVELEQPTALTLVEAADTWRASRVDVVEQTANMHRSAVARLFKVAPTLRTRPIDELEVNDVAALVAALVDAGYKRETIKKTRDALAMLLDFHRVEPNPARDKRTDRRRSRRARARVGARGAGRDGGDRRRTPPYAGRRVARSGRPGARRPDAGPDRVRRRGDGSGHRRACSAATGRSTP